MSRLGADFGACIAATSRCWRSHDGGGVTATKEDGQKQQSELSKAAESKTAKLAHVESAGTAPTTQRAEEEAARKATGGKETTREVAAGNSHETEELAAMQTKKAALASEVSAAAEPKPSEPAEEDVHWANEEAAATTPPKSPDFMADPSSAATTALSKEAPNSAAAELSKPVQWGMLANLKPNASAGQLKQDEGEREQISVVETDLQAAPRNKSGA